MSEAEILRKGIQDFLSGDYEHPRTFRPGRCPHGLNYWEECAGCDIKHFEWVLKAASERVSCESPVNFISDEEFTTAAQGLTRKG
jgi:hypothetical protein